MRGDSAIVALLRLAPAHTAQGAVGVPDGLAGKASISTLLRALHNLRVRPPPESVVQQRQTLRTHPRTPGPASGTALPAHPGDPYRDPLHERRTADPVVLVLQRFGEIKELGSTGSRTLLDRCLTQGRAESDRPVTTPRRLTPLVLTRPDNLPDKDSALVRDLAACPEMTELT